jgi:hypothetical protein
VAKRQRLDETEVEEWKTIKAQGSKLNETKPTVSFLWIFSSLERNAEQPMNFLFRRKVVSYEGPTDLGKGLRLILTLECGHMFHIRPPRRMPTNYGCPSCAHAWWLEHRPGFISRISEWRESRREGKKGAREKKGNYIHESS